MFIKELKEKFEWNQLLLTSSFVGEKQFLFKTFDYLTYINPKARINGESACDIRPLTCFRVKRRVYSLYNKQKHVLTIPPAPTPLTLNMFMQSILEWKIYICIYYTCLKNIVFCWDYFDFSFMLEYLKHYQTQTYPSAHASLTWSFSTSTLPGF